MIGSLKYGLSKVLKKMGYTIIPDWQLSDYPLSEHLRRLFRHFEIDCVLDVGANNGQYRDLLRQQVRYEGNIVSFEPIPEHVSILQIKAVHDRNWFIEECALGSASKEAFLNVMVNTEFSSFLAPDPSKVGNFGGKNEVEKRIPVEVRTIDATIPALRDRLGFRRPYLKMDTQGFDLEVIRGSQRELKSILALQTEVSMKSIYYDMPNYLESIATLEALGFGISGIFPVHSATQFPEAIEFDCVMVNKDFCAQ